MTRTAADIRPSGSVSASLEEDAPEQFLEEAGTEMPWAELQALAERHDAKGQAGWKPGSICGRRLQKSEAGQ